MLLQQLKLNNIRSYIDETIHFTDNSTLLSGDIGSGKSTILLAIEFALFGTSRPDLPGELLLRKGSAQGSVELSFQINNSSVIIRRTLKKDKNNIKQTAGHIIVNNIKKDLTSQELKAEIINLLGYPEEYVTKNKNFIFRYTIYTPQEEMKFILQDNHEIRLDVLRKIFNVDKYKVIRENLQFYLKKMRAKIAELKTKTEPFEEQKNKQKLLKAEKEDLQLSLGRLSPQIKQLTDKLVQEKLALENLEKDQQIFLDLKQEQKTVQLLLKERQTLLQQLTARQKQLKQEIAHFSFPEDLTAEQIKKEIQEAELQRNVCLQKKTQSQERLSQLQQLIQQHQQEIEEITEKTACLSEKEQLELKLKEECSDYHKEVLQKQQQQLDLTLEKFSERITENKTLFLQAKTLVEKIATLEKCPTCLQEVSLDHKNTISREENNKLTSAEQTITELSVKKNEYLQQKDYLQKEIDKLIVKENQLTTVSLEIKQLQEKKGQLEKVKGQLKSLVQENNFLMKESAQFKNEELLSLLEKKVAEKRELLESLTKKNFLELNLQELLPQMSQNSAQLTQLQQKQQELEKDLLAKNDLLPEIARKKVSFNQLTAEERQLSVQQAQLQANFNNLLKNETELQLIIDRLNEQKKELIRLKEIYHWLDQHFLKLTYTLEKQVMLKIHGLFDQLFKEWFSILIDDENVYSRLDDSFTPVIEQNGYEISFLHLSGGEKTSAALAYRLALNKVINDVIHQVKTKDLLILDEPTDGFSTEQLDKVRDVLEKLSLRQIILVSHESKIESFVENIVRVSKNGHVSNVV